MEVGPRGARAYGLGGRGGAMYDNLQIITRELWGGRSGTGVVCWVKDIAGVMDENANIICLILKDIEY